MIFMKKMFDLDIFKLICRKYFDTVGVGGLANKDLRLELGRLLLGLNSKIHPHSMNNSCTSCADYYFYQIARYALI